MLASEIIKRPVITEKSLQLVENLNQYTFEVDRRANKVEIKKAIEELFNVSVVKVNVINTTPQQKRVGQYTGFKPEKTKAIITLKANDKIDNFSA
jgi:large subunit ribosomal protein L23